VRIARSIYGHFLEGFMGFRGRSTSLCFDGGGEGMVIWQKRKEKGYLPESPQRCHQDASARPQDTPQGGIPSAPRVASYKCHKPRTGKQGRERGGRQQE
jgi:hypothetical protein